MDNNQAYDHACNLQGMLAEAGAGNPKKLPIHMRVSEATPEARLNHVQALLYEALGLIKSRDPNNSIEGRILLAQAEGMIMAWGILTEEELWHAHMHTTEALHMHSA